MEGAGVVAGSVQMRWFPITPSLSIQFLHPPPPQSVWGLKYTVTQELSAQGVQQWAALASRLQDNVFLCCHNSL